MQGLLPVLLLAGCVKAPPEALPPRGVASTYQVAVAAASGERAMTALYTLEVVPQRDDVYSVRTVHTEGTWEEGGTRLDYDSSAPQRDDPWPLALQHAVASVPARLQFSEGGSPVGLVEEQGWRMEGLRAMQELELPPEALAAGQQLLDPAGLVRDLQRIFPGTPPQGVWVRQEQIAGLDAQRIEACERTAAGGERTWTCEGEVEGPTEGPARLHEVDSSTVVVADARGLVSLEGTWVGTLVLLDATGDGVLDRPVAGRRLVVRQ